MKVAVYAIAKNEAKEVEGFLGSCKYADHITVVVDSDDTQETYFEISRRLAHCRTVAVHENSIKPFRFDDARNAALSLVPADIDVCISLDLDERLMPGWRDALEKAWVPGTNQANITYKWNAETTFLHNCKVHSRHGWRWKHPGHEAIYPWQITPALVDCSGLVIEHHPDETKPRGNILGLLAWGQYEDPTSTRMMHYYGRELMFNGYYKEALGVFAKYLELEKLQRFPAERAKTIDYVARCCEALNNLKAPVA